MQRFSHGLPSSLAATNIPPFSSHRHSHFHGFSPEGTYAIMALSAVTQGSYLNYRCKQTSCTYTDWMLDSFYTVPFNCAYASYPVSCSLFLFTCGFGCVFFNLRCFNCLSEQRFHLLQE